jgi:hypothetical protein
VAFVLCACGSNAETTTTRPDWTTATAMPTRRAEVAAARIDDRVFVAGGYEGPFVFEAYDLVADSWSTLADLPLPLDHASLAAHEGSLYLAGGGSARLFAYDPATNTWSELGAPPYDRYASAAVVLGARLYLIGGLGPSPETPLRYDFALDEWTTLAPMSVRRDHVGAIVWNGEIHALSGRAADGSNYTSTEIYNPTSDTWRAGSSMHEGRSGFGATELGGKLYVAGGELIVEPVHTLDSVEALDPETNVWSYVTPMPAPIHGCAAVTWDDRLWLFGGSNLAASPVPHDGSVYVYEP